MLLERSGTISIIISHRHSRVVRYIFCQSYSYVEVTLSKKAKAIQEAMKWTRHQTCVRIVRGERSDLHGCGNGGSFRPVSLLKRWKRNEMASWRFIRFVSVEGEIHHCMKLARIKGIKGRGVG